jgi:hypothetical protein
LLEWPDHHLHLKKGHGFFKILRIFDPINIHDKLALCQSARRRGSNRRRFFWNLDKFTPRILAPFWLGWIAAKQFSKHQRNLINEQKVRTLMQGFDLLKALVPKFLGTVNFFFKEVMAHTPSSILASLNSSEEN